MIKAHIRGEMLLIITKLYTRIVMFLKLIVDLISNHKKV